GRPPGGDGARPDRSGVVGRAAWPGRPSGGRAALGVRMLVASRPAARRAHRRRSGRGRAEQEAPARPAARLAPGRPPWNGPPVARLGGEGTSPLAYDVLMRCD